MINVKEGLTNLFKSEKEKQEMTYKARAKFGNNDAAGTFMAQRDVQELPDAFSNYGRVQLPANNASMSERMQFLQNNVPSVTEEQARTNRYIAGGGQTSFNSQSAPQIPGISSARAESTREDSTREDLTEAEKKAQAEKELALRADAMSNPNYKPAPEPAPELTFNFASESAPEPTSMPQKQSTDTVGEQTDTVDGPVVKTREELTMERINNQVANQRAEMAKTVASKSNDIDEAFSGVEDEVKAKYTTGMMAQQDVENPDGIIGFFTNMFSNPRVQRGLLIGGLQLAAGAIGGLSGKQQALLALEGAVKGFAANPGKKEALELAEKYQQLIPPSRMDEFLAAKTSNDWPRVESMLLTALSEDEAQTQAQDDEDRALEIRQTELDIATKEKELNALPETDTITPNEITMETLEGEMVKIPAGAKYTYVTKTDPNTGLSKRYFKTLDELPEDPDNDEDGKDSWLITNPAGTEWVDPVTKQKIVLPYGTEIEPVLNDDGSFKSIKRVIKLGEGKEDADKDKAPVDFLAIESDINDINDLKVVSKDVNGSDLTIDYNYTYKVGNEDKTFTLPEENLINVDLSNKYLPELRSQLQRAGGSTFSLSYEGASAGGADAKLNADSVDDMIAYISSEGGSVGFSSGFGVDFPDELEGDKNKWKRDELINQLTTVRKLTSGAVQELMSQQAGTQTESDQKLYGEKLGLDFGSKDLAKNIALIELKYKYNSGVFDDIPDVPPGTRQAYVKSIAKQIHTKYGSIHGDYTSKKPTERNNDTKSTWQSEGRPGNLPGLGPVVVMPNGDVYAVNSNGSQGKKLGNNNK